MINTAGETLTILAISLAVQGTEQGQCSLSEIASSLCTLAKLVPDLQLTMADCATGFDLLSQEQLKGNSFLPGFGRGIYKAMAKLAKSCLQPYELAKGKKTNLERALRQIAAHLACSTEEHHWTMAEAVLREADQLAKN